MRKNNEKNTIAIYHHFNKDDFTDLNNHKSGPCLSIYIQTRPGEEQTRQNRVRFKNRLAHVCERKKYYRRLTWIRRWYCKTTRNSGNIKKMVSPCLSLLKWQGYTVCHCVSEIFNHLPVDRFNQIDNPYFT